MTCSKITRSKVGVIYLEERALVRWNKSVYKGSFFRRCMGILMSSRTRDSISTVLNDRHVQVKCKYCTPKYRVPLLAQLGANKYNFKKVLIRCSLLFITYSTFFNLYVSPTSHDQRPSSNMGSFCRCFIQLTIQLSRFHETGKRYRAPKIPHMISSCQGRSRSKDGSI